MSRNKSESLNGLTKWPGVRLLFFLCREVGLKIFGGGRAFDGNEIFWSPCEEKMATFTAAFRANLDHKVGVSNNIHVVLDHNNASASLYQTTEGFE